MKAVLIEATSSSLKAKETHAGTDARNVISLSEWEILMILNGASRDRRLTRKS